MESELKDLTAEKKQMHLRISEQQDKLRACHLELKKKDARIRDFNKIIKNIQTDIQAVSEFYQNPAKLKDVVKVSRYTVNMNNQLGKFES